MRPVEDSARWAVWGSGIASIRDSGLAMQRRLPRGDGAAVVRALSALGAGDVGDESLGLRAPGLGNETERGRAERHE
jgi:hypothetical protein